jgi:hypothetical protein
MNEATIPNERNVCIFMVKLQNHATEFASASTNSHYAQDQITADVMKSSFFDGANSVNTYFYQSSNENTAFKGTIVDWIDYGYDMTGE